MSVLILLLLVTILITQSSHGATQNTIYSKQRTNKATTAAVNRKVYAFGSNYYGQLGQKDYSIPQSVDFFSGLNVSQLCVQQDATGSYQRTFFVVNSYNSAKLYGMGTATQVYHLGLNMTGSYTQPQLIYTSTTTMQIKSMACGSEHVLFVLSNSQVYGFGSNNYEQLGFGFDYLELPTRLANAALQAKAVDQVFAFAASSFLIESGTQFLYGWGNNDFRKMGLAGNPLSDPTLLSGGGLFTTVRKVVGYGASMLVLTTDGKVYGAGQNDQGSLGVNSAVTQITNMTQLNFGTETVNDVAIYRTGGLASTQSGSLYYWGVNDQLQLCTGSSDTTTVNLAPVKASTTFASPIQQISLAYQHTLLLAQNNQLWVCGDNSYGQLGLSTWQSQTISPIQMSGQSNLGGQSIQALLATSYKNSFILTSNGTLYTMGRIDGSGDRVDYTTPTLVMNIPNDAQFEHVYAGYGMSFATETITGKTFAWGRNRSPFNMVNPGTTIDQFNPRIMTDLASYNISQISIGAYTVSTLQVTVFFLKNDTRGVFVMGSNTYGQFGNGSISGDVTTRPIPLTYFNNTLLIDSISNGASHTLFRAKKTTDTTDYYDMYVFGGNTKGQIAYASLTDVLTSPLRIKFNVAQVAASDLHSLFLQVTAKGGSGSGTKTYYNKALGSGDNSYGQLGLDALTQSNTFREMGNLNSNSAGTFVNITSISAIYTGSGSTFIVTGNGTYVVGDNTYGQLGLNPAVNGTKFLTPILNPNLPQNILKIVIANSGGQHTVMLTSDGSVWVMGYNANGQLGLGHKLSVYTPTQVSLPQTPALDIAVGNDHTLILTGQRSCPGGCNYKGDCDVVTGYCNCASGFTGYDCNLYSCLDAKCNGHGSCDTSVGICVCDSDYTGASCQYRRCPNNCNGHGTCNYATGVCTCDDGYTSTIDCAAPDVAADVFRVRSVVTLLVVAFAFLLLLVNRRG